MDLQTIDVEHPSRWQQNWQDPIGSSSIEWPLVNYKWKITFPDNWLAHLWACES